MTGSIMNVSGGYSYYASSQTVSRKETTTFDEMVSAKADEVEKPKSQRGTVMADYYAKKPQYREVQEKRVKGGYSVPVSEKVTEKKSGHIEESMEKYPQYAEDWKRLIAKGHQIAETYPPVKSREEMTMEEYKSYIGSVIDNIPVDISQRSTETSIVISDEAWETMKDDPDFEAYVIGGLEYNFTYKNPWMTPPSVKRYEVMQIGVPMENYHASSWGDLSYGTTADSDAHFRELSKGESFRKKPDPQVIKRIEAKRLEEKRQKTEREKKIVEKQRRVKEEYKTFLRKKADAADFMESSTYGAPNTAFQAYEAMFGGGMGMWRTEV